MTAQLLLAGFALGIVTTLLLLLLAVFVVKAGINSVRRNETTEVAERHRESLTKPSLRHSHDPHPELSYWDSPEERDDNLIVGVDMQGNLIPPPLP